VLILINGLLAMSEMAVVSANRVRLQYRAESGSAGAAAALSIADDPNRFLSTVQIGITLVGILAGAFGGATLSVYVADWLDDVAVVGRYADATAFVLVVSSITYFSLVIGELVPKRLALQNAELISALVAKPMLNVSRVAGPLVWLLGASTNLILRLLRVRTAEEPAITEEEVAILMQQGAQAGVFERSEHALVMNVLSLGDRVTAQVMTPRMRVASININASRDEIQQVVSKSTHQTFPVVDGSLDRVLGIVSMPELWRLLTLEDVSPHDIMRPPVFVPETMSLFSLLEHLQKTRDGLALVVNEYGGVEGLVTLRDVVDEIISATPPALADEHADQSMVHRDDGSWLVDGLVSLHDITDVIGTTALDAWAADRYQTLGGFVMGELGRVPAVGDVVQWNDWQFEVVDMDGYRVDRVLISRPEKPSAASADG
jgi:putative hemolysin